MRVEMKNVQFSFHKNSESLFKNQKFCTAQGTLYVLKMGEVCACGGGGGTGGGGGGGGGTGSGECVRLKTPDGVSFWESEFLTHPMISVFQGLSLEINFSVDV